MAAKKEDLWKLWYAVNPCHEINGDTGEDMFYSSAELVMSNIWEAATKAAEARFTSTNTTKVETVIPCDEDGCGHPAEVHLCARHYFAQTCVV